MNPHHWSEDTAGSTPQACTSPQRKDPRALGPVVSKRHQGTRGSQKRRGKDPQRGCQSWARCTVYTARFSTVAPHTARRSDSTSAAATNDTS